MCAFRIGKWDDGFPVFGFLEVRFCSFFVFFWERLLYFHEFWVGFILGFGISQSSFGEKRGEKKDFRGSGTQKVSQLRGFQVGLEWVFRGFF